MPATLTGQVRNMPGLTTGCGGGDLSRKITVDVKGEILELEKHHQHHGGLNSTPSLLK